MQTVLALLLITFAVVRYRMISPIVVWAPSQYPKRRLFVRSCEVSKPRDWYFRLSYRFEIWQAHRQQCCRYAWRDPGLLWCYNPTTVSVSRKQSWNVCGITLKQANHTISPVPLQTTLWLSANPSHLFKNYVPNLCNMYLNLENTRVLMTSQQWKSMFWSWYNVNLCRICL